MAEGRGPIQFVSTMLRAPVPPGPQVVSRFSFACAANAALSDRIRRFASARPAFAEVCEAADPVHACLTRIWPQGAVGTFIVSNLSWGDTRKEASWLMRPPRVEQPPGFLDGPWAPALQVHRRQGRLAVGRFEVTPNVAPRPHERVFRAPVIWNDPDVYMEGDELDMLQQLEPRRRKTHARLADWHAYLAWKEQLCRRQQIAARYYLAWHPDKRSIAFLVAALDDQDRRRLRGEELGFVPVEASEEPEFWKPSERRGDRPEMLGKPSEVIRIGAGELDRLGADPDLARELGGFDAIVFKLDDDEARTLARDEVPEEGFLLSSLAGELGPLKSQRTAIERLENDAAFCRGLGDFLFDATAAAVPEPSVLEAALPARVKTLMALYDSQRRAVAKALAAPELCLIQGPPGTGKTTVIAEICWQVARRGGRVAVASQTNLAVDNALGRLADLPEIRRLRLGQEDRIDPEYKDFHESQVIGRWAQTAAGACRQRIERGLRDAGTLAARQQALAALRRLAEDEAADAQARATVEEQRGRLDPQARQLAELRAAHEEARDLAQARRVAAEGIEAWARRAGERPSGAHLAGTDAGAALLEAVGAAVAGLPAGCELRRDRVAHPAEALSLAERLRAARPACAEASELLERALLLCRRNRGDEADGALRALLAERDTLIEATTPEELARLGRINERIRAARKAGEQRWPEMTSALRRLAERAGLADEGTRRVVDALGPSKDLAGTLERLAGAFIAIDVAAASFEDALHGLDFAGWIAAAGHALRSEQAFLADVDQRLEKCRGRIDELAGRIADLDAARTARADAWRDRWRATSAGEAPPPHPDVEAVARLGEALAVQLAEQTAAAERAARWREVQEAWIDRLRDIAPAERALLLETYKRTANVIGLTCNEAGKWQVYEADDFRPFDLVIIDEVSKATPTELLMPMLLGRKIVLVGDHRQLPPMFRERESSFESAIADGEIRKEDFERYRRLVTAGLFEELFTQAPEALKETLDVQYRMHPQVMDATNQFYDDRLKAGPTRDALDGARQHGLWVPDRHGGWFIEPGQHLLWLDSTYDENDVFHAETQRDSSKSNALECRLVVAAARAIGEALVLRGYGFQVEDRRADDDAINRPVGDWVRRLLPQLSEETLAELVRAGRVRLDGRGVGRLDRRVRRDEVLSVDGRKSVGLLTFYGAQAGDLRDEVEKERRKASAAFDAVELRVNTVDRFQGMERPIVIASLVRCTRGDVGGFVREYKRINVGLSRAQELLVIVGSMETFAELQLDLPPLDAPPGDKQARKVPVYARIIERVRQSGGHRHAWQLLG
jgi:hypothetical protein